MTNPINWPAWMWMLANVCIGGIVGCSLIIGPVVSFFAIMLMLAWLLWTYPKT